jgi:hypothetical protein
MTAAAIAAIVAACALIKERRRPPPAARPAGDFEPCRLPCACIARPKNTKAVTTSSSRRRHGEQAQPRRMIPRRPHPS